MPRTVLLALATGVAVGGVLSGLLVSGVLGEDAPQKPPGKVAVELTATAERATALARPHPTKPYPPPTIPPTPPSCPVDTSRFQSEVREGAHYQPPPSLFSARDKTVLTVASAVGSNGLYMLYSGRLSAEPFQGFIAVQRWPKDPCAEGRNSYEPQLYLTPFKRGAVTLLATEGDSVTFRTADGTAGRFEYTTGQFR